jgi:ribosomal protein S18 acetylase RimI-like enzyme
MPDRSIPSVIVSSLGAGDLPGAFTGIVDVYRAAFSAPPYHRGEDDARDFAESLERHASFAGFQAVVARTDPGDAIVGFAYGYTLAPGQWWYEQVAPVLGPEQASATLTGAFLMTQLAVLPECQGRGIGSRLHDSLLLVVSNPGAVLSTRQDDSPARHLYRRRGWLTLIEDVAFPGADHPYQVLIRDKSPATRTQTSVERGGNGDDEVSGT